ncbi:MAG: putative transporter [Actinomycetia bacterium]|nr:putative transporter [Actinomycetes bacterium]
MAVAVEGTPRIDAAPARPARGPAGVAVALFALTALMGTGLLFAAAPMVVKMLLPDYGGSPMVWNISVLLLQIALVMGCFFAHWSQRLLSARRQLLIQIPLLIAPMFVLPFALPTWSVAQGSALAALWLLLVLVAVAGTPVTVLSMAVPLVQRWYSWTGLPRSKDPYFLYAIGNVGGILVLLAYPFLIEPVADLADQARWWAVGYGLFAALVVACRLIVRFSSANVTPMASAEAGTAPDEQISWWRRARWLGLAFIPSSLMLGVTTHISVDLNLAPLMWVPPLALYLATFVIAFGFTKQRWLSRTVTVVAISAAVLPWTLYLIGFRVRAGEVLLSLALVFVGGLACHGLLAKDRPSPRRLTEFFLVISLGGALGGAFDDLVAPMAFTWTAELPLAVTALAILPLILSRRPDTDAPWRFPGTGALVKAFVLAGPLLAVAVYLELGGLWLVVAAGAGCLPWCVLAVRRPRVTAMGAVLTTVGLFWYQTPADSFRERTFFGNYQIYTDNGWRVLSSGPTARGYQYPSGRERTIPVSYYGQPGPLGDLFADYGDRSARVAVVGLGTGIVASYGRQGQEMDFYEIDPAAVKIATDRFGYLNDSKAAISLIAGDGRLRLGQEPDGWYGMIVLDTFSSAVVPSHLLTKQALQMYASKLRPGGLLAFHVTNRDLDLAPMLQATARAAGLAALTGHGQADPNRIYQGSTWVAVARNDADLKPLRAKAWRWHTLPADGPVWTDAHSALFSTPKAG